MNSIRALCIITDILDQGRMTRLYKPANFERYSRTLVVDGMVPEEKDPPGPVHKYVGVIRSRMT